MVVNHRSHNVDTAMHGAIDRLKRSLEHSFQKRDDPRAAALEFADSDAGALDD